MDKIDKQTLLLCSKLLEIAADEFSNHGCTDLDSSVTELVTDEKRLLEDIRIYNKEDEEENDWPEKIAHVDDWVLMNYLSDKLFQIANNHFKP